MARQVSTFATAVVVVGRPLDEFFGFLTPPAARRHGVGAEMARLALAEALQANLGRGGNEHDQVTQSRLMALRCQFKMVCAPAAINVPELQRRGLFRREYQGATLRENLGLPRPRNRFF
jgi:hypothetical protein